MLVFLRMIEFSFLGIAERSLVLVMCKECAIFIGGRLPMVGVSEHLQLRTVTRRLEQLADLADGVAINFDGRECIATSTDCRLGSDMEVVCGYNVRLVLRDSPSDETVRLYYFDKEDGLYGTHLPAEDSKAPDSGRGILFNHNGLHDKPPEFLECEQEFDQVMRRIGSALR